MAKHIVMYESKLCGFCSAARRVFSQKGWEYESIVVDGQPEARAKMIEITGRTSVPQIFIGDTHVGGFDDMVELDQNDELDELYNAA